MKATLLLLSTLSFLSIGRVNAEDKVVITACGPSEYVLFKGSEARNEAGARAKCKEVGGYLAKVAGKAEFTCLSSRISSASWIDSWNGDDYGNACIVLWPGGAITENPDQGCAGVLPFICEFPGYHNGGGGGGGGGNGGDKPHKSDSCTDSSDHERRKRNCRRKRCCTSSGDL